MTQEEFNVVFELQMRKCADILAHKKKEYTGDNIDRLSAFKIAAALQNCDPKAALAGMMSKHVVSSGPVRVMGLPVHTPLLQAVLFVLFHLMQLSLQPDKKK